MTERRTVFGVLVCAYGIAACGGRLTPESVQGGVTDAGGGAASTSHAGTSSRTTGSTLVFTTSASSTSSRATTTGITAATSSSSSSGGTTWIWAFNQPSAGLEGWVFNPYQTSADPYLDADNGIDPNNLSAQATLFWDGDGGTVPLAPVLGPVNGEMTVAIPFSAYDQRADFHIVPIPPVAMDLSQSVVSMYVKVDPAPDGGIPFSPNLNAPGGVVMYIKTGASFVYGQSAYRNIVPTDHDWVLFTFDVKNEIDLAFSPEWLDAGDPTNVVELGFYFHTGGGGIPAGADASPYPNPTPATFHIDSIGISPAP
jgi:hypothetical protein